MALINDLINKGWLKTPEIIKAFKKIKRIDFLPKDVKGFYEADSALPIGKGQTISQPAVVAFMLEKLEPKPGDKILDIGSGSGWTSALLAFIVGLKGKVIGIELVNELKELGENSAKKYNKGNMEFISGDGSLGYKKQAPYNKILCSATIEQGKDIPLAWKEQLKIGGRIVTPIKNSIFLFIKKENGFEKQEFPGFIFVPLIQK